MKKIIVSAVICILILGMVLYGINKEKKNVKTGLDNIKSKGTFIMGVDDSYPPFSYTNENNELVGFDVDLAKEVCKRLGVELLIQPISWNAKEQELNTRNIDCIWSGMDLTEEREKAFAMSEAYSEGGMVFVVNNDSDIASLAGLTGKKVGVQGASSDETTLENSNLYKDLKEVITYSNSLTGLLDLETKNIDAYLLSEKYAKYYITSNNKNLKTIDSGFSKTQTGIAFRKADIDLKNKVNEILEEMRNDGTTEQISKKWYGTYKKIGE